MTLLTAWRCWAPRSGARALGGDPCVGTHAASFGAGAAWTPSPVSFRCTGGSGFALRVTPSSPGAAVVSGKLPILLRPRGGVRAGDVRAEGRAVTAGRSESSLRADETLRETRAGLPLVSVCQPGIEVTSCREQPSGQRVLPLRRVPDYLQ